MPSPAAHRQTRYVAAPGLAEPTPLPLPEATADVDQAKADLTEYGVCILTGVLDDREVGALRDRLERQAAAERALGDRSPYRGDHNRQLLSNMVNKGREFLDLVVRPEADELAGYLLGKSFLLSSMTAGVFLGPTTEPQQLHRDQGQVPATADFAASCNLFWLLDDFTPERGSTWLVPGSHRWPAEHLIKPPPREKAVQITAPAGSVYCWDGRVWHSAGANPEGHPRRHVTTFFCLPWTRQQLPSTHAPSVAEFLPVRHAGRGQEHMGAERACRRDDRGPARRAPLPRPAGRSVPLRAVAGRTWTGRLGRR